MGVFAGLPSAARAAGARVQWNRNSENNITGYVIYYGTSSRNYSSTQRVGDVTTTTINGLSENTTYYFAVTAVNSLGGESTYSTEASYTIPASHVLPTFDAIDDVTLDENTFAGPNEFFLIGGSGYETNLLLSARSDNTTLFPNNVANLNLEQEGTNYYFTLTPAANAYGTARIQLFVSDGVQTNSTNFLVTVRSVNSAPFMSVIPSVTASQYADISPISFTVSDTDNYTSQLTVTATSSDQSVLANDDIILSGIGSSRTIDFDTSSGHAGVTTIFLTVSDGQTNYTRSFTVRLNQANEAPHVDAGTNAVVLMNANYLLRGHVTDDGMPTNINHVTVEWSVVSGPGTVTFGTPNFVMTSARFSAAGFYRLRLTASDGDLSSSADVYVMVRVNTDVTGPVISDLTVADVTATTVTLTWTTDEVADRQIEYTPDGGVSRNTFMNVNRQMTHSVVVTNLQPGTTYTMKARSRDSSGNKSISSPVVVSTLQPVNMYLSSLVSQAHVVTPMETLQSPEGDSYAQVSTPGEGSVQFQLHIPVHDTYYVWARVLAPSTASDSLTCSLNNEVADIFDLAQGSWSDQWQWVVLNGRDGGDPLTLNPRTFTLEAGSHTLTFAALEAGTALSRILVTNDPHFVPTDDEIISSTYSPLRSGESVMQINIRNGWSMLSNPLNSLNTTILELFPNPIPGTAFYKYDTATGAFEPNTYAGGNWSHPEMTLGLGEGGLLFNPGESFTWSVHGTVLLNASPLEVVPGGTTLITLTTPVGGSLTQILRFPFQAGDQVKHINQNDGTYITNTFNGTEWDVVPVLNVGESIFLLLTPR